MTENELDPQELAAFIEGRLEGAARERVVRTLARSDHSYEVFAEAVQVGEELQLPVEQIDVSRIVGLKKFMRLRRTQLAAATLAVLVVGSFAIQRIITSAGQFILPAASVVAILADQNDFISLPEGWDQPGWRVTRGRPAPFVEPQIAFRIGVRALDIQIALQRSNLEETGFYAGQIIDLLQDVTASQPVQSMYRDLRSAIGSGAPRDSLILLADQADQQADIVFESPYIGLGKWIEGARIAVLLGDTGFFTFEVTRSFLNSVDNAGYSGDIASRVQQVRAVVESGVAPTDLSEVGKLLEGVVRAGAG